MPEPSAAARAELHARLGIPSLPESLLDEALTHSSFLNEAEDDAASNERLEYLGDAVLDMIVARDLFDRFPEVDEGDLTRMRASIVRGETLAQAARALGLGEHLLMGNGEVSAGGRDRDSNLAGLFEAIVGAVYLHLGLEAADDLVHRLLNDDLATVEAETTEFDPKSALQQLAQARWHEPPRYRTVEEVLVDGRFQFTVEVLVAGEVAGQGSGLRKRDAQQEAAKAAIARLQD